MSNRARSYPSVMPGLVILGAPRLRELAAALGISLSGVHPAPGAIAAALRDRSAAPEDLAAHLTAADLDAVGPRLGVGDRAELGAGYAAAVLARLLKRRDLPAAPAERPTRRSPANAPAWPELASLAAWGALGEPERQRLAEQLAAALGPHVRPATPAGAMRLARVWDARAGLALVAIPGGQLSVGLSDAERRALARLARGWGEEAQAHLRDLAEVARPAHRVALPPLLCADAPVTRASPLAAAQAAETVGPGLCWLAAGELDRLCDEAGARLLSEAEWEHIARAGGARGWLSGDEPPHAYAARALAEGLAADEQSPLGVRGLAWGSWVEDSWQAGYQGAPADGSARAPRAVAQVARGGALLSYPWQTDGEALLLHAAHRERAEGQRYPALLARDLPGRGD